MNRKGFTLVEILAVVAIIGVLAIIVLPNILNSTEDAKLKNFISEAQGVYKTANNQYVLDRAYGTVYNYEFGSCPNFTTSPIGTKSLDVSNRDGSGYQIIFDTDGDIVSFVMCDNDRLLVLPIEGKTKVDFKDINSSNVSEK